jgi:RHS repeat-associated protein
MMLQVRVVLAAFAFFFATATHASVNPTTGEFETEVVDIWVKVPGGKLSWVRSYERNAWEFNSHWQKLKVEIDALEGTVSRVHLGRDAYEKVDSAGTLFRYDQRRTIQKTESGWRWQNRDGDWMEYAESGLLERFGDRVDNIIRLEYAPDGKLIGVHDGIDRKVLTVTWTGELLTEVRDFTDRVVTYRYAGGLLTEVVDVRGKPWRYEYSGGRLVKLIDPLNSATSLTLTKSGRVGVTTGPDGAVTRTTFDYLSGPKLYYLKTVRENGGMQEVVETWTDREREVVRRDVNGVTVLRVARDGRKRTHSDYRGRQTAYDFDEFRNLVKTTYPDGTSTRSTYEPSTSNVLEEINEDGVITEYRYDIRGLRTHTIAARGTPVERVTKYNYNSLGLLVAIVQKGDSVTTDAITTYRYDVAGNLTFMTDPEGGITEFRDFDAMGNPQLMRDPRENQWSRTYDAAGNLISAADPLGNSTNYHYDDAGRSIKTVYPEVDGIRAFTAFRFDGSDRLVEVTDMFGETRRVEYDQIGNRIAEYDEQGNAQTYRFDAFNRLTQWIDADGNVTVFDYPSAESPVVGDGDLYQPNSIRFPTFVRLVSYDARGRPVAAVEQFSSGARIEQRSTRLRLSPTGLPIETVELDGRTSTRELDALGQVVSTTNKLGGKTEISYDARGNVIKVVDAKGNTYGFSYDRLDRLLAERRPEGQMLAHEYDLSGNMIRKTSGSGGALFTYDSAGLLESETFFAGGATEPERVVSYSYNGRGSLIRWQDGDMSAVYSYDPLQRRTMETISFGDGTELSHEFGYDSVGRKSVYLAVDQSKFTYSYTGAGLLKSIGRDGDTIIEVGDFGWKRPMKVVLGSVGEQNFDYDGLLRMTHSELKSKDGSVRSARSYSYDQLGNLKEISSNKGVQGFGYDEVGRLVSASTSLGQFNLEEIFAYDEVGNRSASTDPDDESWRYDMNNAPLSLGPVTFGLNASGSVTEIRREQDVITLTYDSSDRMVSAQTQSGSFEYRYDPFGRRLVKIGNGIAEYYMYTDEGLAAIVNGGTKRILIHSPEGDWAETPLLLVTGTDVVSLLNDNIGRPVGALSFASDELLEWAHSSFGIRIGESPVPSGYAGQWEDPETGFYYNFYRYYDPGIGRYLQPDPLGLEGGVNMYAYANNNPLRYVDPFGLTASCTQLVSWPGFGWEEVSTRAVGDGRWALRNAHPMKGVGGLPGIKIRFNASYAANCLAVFIRTFEDVIKKFRTRHYLDMCTVEDCSGYRLTTRHRSEIEQVGRERIRRYDKVEDKATKLIPILTNTRGEAHEACSKWVRSLN